MKRCMFVDDSSVIRKVAKRILSGSNLLVVEAESGMHALAICENAMPDIIIVDSALEDIPTVDFIRRVRQIDSLLKPQVAICLTEFDLGAIMRAKRAGAQGYLLKPFTRPQLLERFRTLDAAA
ncbi:MAG: response regulator [Rhizobiaceae bacterium]|nr:response regulator [Rhizobiaceae bacterium]